MICCDRRCNSNSNNNNDDGDGDCAWARQRGEFRTRCGGVEGKPPWHRNSESVGQGAPTFFSLLRAAGCLLGAWQQQQQQQQLHIGAAPRLERPATTYHVVGQLSATAATAYSSLPCVGRLCSVSPHMRTRRSAFIDAAQQQQQQQQHRQQWMDVEGQAKCNKVCPRRIFFSLILSNVRYKYNNVLFSLLQLSSSTPSASVSSYPSPALRTSSSRPGADLSSSAAPRTATASSQPSPTAPTLTATTGRHLPTHSAFEPRSNAERTALHAFTRVRCRFGNPPEPCTRFGSGFAKKVEVRHRTEVRQH